MVLPALRLELASKNKNPFSSVHPPRLALR